MTDDSAAYLRIEDLDPSELDDADRDLFEDLANGVFAHLRDEAPELYEAHKGVIPVRNPEHDPRLLETTAVYAHRDATRDDGVSDFVFASFDDPVDGLDAPGYASVHEYVEVQLSQSFDDGREALDEVLPTEGEREAQGDPPVRVGTLYYDKTSDRVVRVECEDCGRRGLPEQIDADHDCPGDEDDRDSREVPENGVTRRVDDMI